MGERGVVRGMWSGWKHAEMREGTMERANRREEGGGRGGRKGSKSKVYDVKA